jgi:hypothetical protein
MLIYTLSMYSDSACTHEECRAFLQVVIARKPDLFEGLRRWRARALWKHSMAHSTRAIVEAVLGS